MQMSAAIYIVPRRTPTGKQEGENHAGGREIKYGFKLMGVAEECSMRWPLQACEMVMLWLRRMKHHRDAPPVTQGSSLTKIAIMGQTPKS